MTYNQLIPMIKKTVLEHEAIIMKNIEQPTFFYFEYET